MSCGSTISWRADRRRCARRDRPPRIFRAVEALTGAVIGHRLFTIMRHDPERGEVERLHSSMPSVYPVGGRKKKKDTAWSAHVLRDMRVFRANDPDGIRAAFDDHATIASLGLGAVLNIPVVLAARCVGTMNLLHEAGWYTEQDEVTGLLLGGLALRHCCRAPSRCGERDARSAPLAPGVRIPAHRRATAGWGERLSPQICVFAGRGEPPHPDPLPASRERGRGSLPSEFIARSHTPASTSASPRPSPCRPRA